MQKYRALEEELNVLQKMAKEKTLSMEDILHILSGKGRPLILILLSLPFCQPIQIPGFSIPFGLMIAFLGLRIGFGHAVWLPQKLLNMKVDSKTLIKITDWASLLLKKMKRWTYPRLTWFCQSPLMEKANGIVISMLGILLALPLPIPLSNLTAAWSIFFIALGILEDDGLFVTIGYLISLLTLIFFLVIAFILKNSFT